MSNTVLPLRRITSGKELCDIALETGAIDFDYTSITTPAIEELVSDISNFLANAQKPGTIAIRIARDKIATNLIARCKQYGTPLSAETFGRTCYDVDDSDSLKVVYGDWSEECLVIRLGCKGEVVSSADVGKLLSGYCSSSDAKLQTTNNVEDRIPMFNVMVTAQDNGWEEGAYEWEKSRILESTDEQIKARFASLDEEALQTLSSLPTLFMYEQNTDGLPRVGKIKRIQTRGGRDIRVIFEFDDNLPVMTIDNLIKLKWELGLHDFEFSRTHWAVKQGDLYEILREAGLAPQPAAAAVTSESKPDKPAAVETTPTKVFLVHGRDDGRKQAIARFLETRAGLNVIVLSERANRGRSILEKFQQEADATSYAVVLMTADDLGHLRPEFSPNGVAPKPRHRARQNVIFELGFFIGKLGSNRVCALVPDNVERPSDYDGIAYVPLDDGEAWQRPLITELHGADLPISPTWWKVD